MRINRRLRGLIAFYLIISMASVAMFMMPKQILAQTGYSGIKQGVFIEYRGDYKIGRVTIWTFSLQINFESISRDGTISISGKYSFVPTVVSSVSSPEAFDDIKVENSQFNAGVAADDLYVRLFNLPWGDINATYAKDIVDVPFADNITIDPAVIFNVDGWGTLVNFFEDEVWKDELGRVIGMTIVKESWDIILGTKRDILYVEFYVTNWYYIQNLPAIVECTFGIDKKLGVITSERISWSEGGIDHVIEINIQNTNAFPRNQLWLTIGIIFIGIVVAVIGYTLYKRRKKEV